MSKPLMAKTALEIMRGRNQVERAKEYARFIELREKMYKKYKDVLIQIPDDYFLIAPEHWTVSVVAYVRSEKVINTVEQWRGFPSSLLTVQLELLHG